MFEIRIHGRGGQGVVTAAEMLSIAAFLEGKHAQACPSFGSERMGAPVVAFCRIDESEIRSREPVVEPDVVIIQDPTLLHSANVFEGLRPDGYVLLNTSKSFAALGIGEIEERLPEDHAWAVPATELALRYVGRPIPNAALLGSFAAVAGVVTLASVRAAIETKFRKDVAEKNIAAATAAYESVREKEAAPC